MRVMVPPKAERVRIVPICIVIRMVERVVKAIKWIVKTTKAIADAEAIAVTRGIIMAGAVQITMPRRPH